MKFTLLHVAGLVFLAAAFLLTEYPKQVNYSDNLLHAYFLDVGQGDSALIKLPDKKLILIDGGPSESIISEISAIIPFYVDTLDLVIISHSHADHISGLIPILNKYRINCLVYKDNDKVISEVESELRRLIEEKGVVKGEDCFTSEFAVVKNFFLAEKDYAKIKESELNENLESIISLVSYSHFDILYTGDAEIPVQQALFDSITTDIEVLKVPHQGARDSYYPAFLKKLKPEIAIISVGKNQWGHPHTETLNGYT